MHQFQHFFSFCDGIFHLHFFIPVDVKEWNFLIFNFHIKIFYAMAILHHSAN